MRAARPRYDGLGLFDHAPAREPMVPPPIHKESRLAAEFQKFHRENPHVYAALVRLARLALSRGRTHLGISMLWEVLRWEYLIDVSSADIEYKLNNNHRSRYARMIMASEQDLANVFDVRELSDGTP